MSSAATPTASADEQVCQQISAAYRLGPSRLIERKRNPHLDHECETPEYEVQAHCHPACRWDELVTVEYDAANGYQCLAAVSTCGIVSVWTD